MGFLDGGKPRAGRICSGMGLLFILFVVSAGFRVRARVLVGRVCLNALKRFIWVFGVRCLR